MKTAEVRASFLKFFGDRQHQVVSSDSLIPSTDPTLLFTSAGMVQFKPNFQNPASSPYPRATSSQKCLRTSDIERVGTTLRHLTFFEMLGNFSFGDYFKAESIAWGWEFITKTMGLPGDRFVVSVHKSDDEAFALWEKLVAKDRIYRLDDDTNFWTMGPTGPCGPCSEILWDRGAEWSCGKSTCSPACDCDRYLEIWNHVFTQFDRSADGKLTPLPRKNIDTGMGLERLSLLMQGATSPFGTDGFQAVTDHLAKLLDRPAPLESKKPQAPTPEQTSFRRIADHARAVTFMIADGILPSNEGRGYVLRRLLRQAVRAGKMLGRQEPFLFELTSDVIENMQSAYPEITQRRETIRSVVQGEEEKFLETLDTGIRKFEEIVGGAGITKTSRIPGTVAFQLYETFGFPFELTLEMAKDAGLTVDEEGFKAAQTEASERAKKGWKGSGAQDVDRYREWKDRSGLEVTFCGYDYKGVAMESEAIGPFYRKTESGWDIVDKLEKGQEGEIVLRQTPFYSEAGGQVGDQGTFSSASGKATVLDTQRPVPLFTVHRVRVDEGVLSVGQTMAAYVDPALRAATMRHHTATHMLHRALRDVLGPHVTQAGSLVAPDRLRFDFNHNSALTLEQRREIENLVNDYVMKDLPVRACEMSKEQAFSLGAMALFGEKYGNRVRTVAISEFDDCEHLKDAWSLELCGGTHVRTSGRVGVFKIIGQSSVSAGVRRLEALAGPAAIQHTRKFEARVMELADKLKTTTDDLPARFEKMLAREKQLEKEIQSLKSTTVRDQFNDLVKGASSVGGLTFISKRLEGVDEKGLGAMADRLKQSGSLGLVVLAIIQDEKVSFVVSVKKEIADRGIQAGLIAKELSAMIDGSGGGRPEFAKGGGRNVAGLDAALASVEAIIKKMSVSTHHK